MEANLLLAGPNENVAIFTANEISVPHIDDPSTKRVLRFEQKHLPPDWNHAVTQTL
jgi:hypothetical protein